MASEPENPRAVFARNVAEIRQRRGLTQEALGWAARLHQTEIARIEKGKRNPGFDTIVKLARGLDVSVAELMTDI